MSGLRKNVSRDAITGLITLDNSKSVPMTFPKRIEHTKFFVVNCGTKFSLFNYYRG